MVSYSGREQSTGVPSELCESITRYLTVIAIGSGCARYSPEDAVQETLLRLLDQGWFPETHEEFHENRSLYRTILKRVLIDWHRKRAPIAQAAFGDGSRARREGSLDAAIGDSGRVELEFGDEQCCCRTRIGRLMPEAAPEKVWVLADYAALRRFGMGPQESVRLVAARHGFIRKRILTLRRWVAEFTELDQGECA